MADDPARTLAVAQRRVEQLEAALMRRTELLEQKQAELANIKASKAYQLVSNAQKLFNRGFPIHTRRRWPGRVPSAGTSARRPTR